MKNYKQHPLSAAFPAMSDEDFAALVADIRQHGQRDVATLCDGMVIDGWHRYSACVEIGIPCRFEELAAADPVAFVLSKNLHRRQLTASQRAAAVVAARAWRPADVAGKPSNRGTGAAAAPVSKTTAQLAEEAGTGERTIVQAKRAHEAGLTDSIRDGKISAERASEIAKLPEPERAAAIEAPKSKPKLAAPVVDLEAEIAELRDRNAELESIIAEIRADNESMAKVFEANDQIVTAMAEIKQRDALIRTLNERIGGFQNERNEHIRLIKSWRKKAEARAA